MPRLSEHQVNELIINLYQGVVHGGHWQYWLETFLQDAGSDAGWVTLVDKQTLAADSLADVGFEGIADYNHYYHDKDMVAEALMVNRELKEGRFYAIQEVVDFDNYLNSEIYNDFNSDHGILHLCGGYASLPGSDKVFRLSFFRGADKAPFNTDFVRRLDLLMPHLTQTLQLDELSRYHLQCRSGPFRHLDEMKVGAVVCDASGRVRSYNAEAESLLLSNGIGKICGGRLVLSDHQQQQALQQALYRACNIVDQHSVPQLSPLMLGSRSSPLEALVRPWCVSSHSFEDASLNAVVLLRSHQQAEHLSLSLMQRQMGLSARELDVAHYVARGLDARSIAHECFVAETTVRTHIQSLLRKFNVNSQQQLIARLHDPLLTLAGHPDLPPSP
ncbi:helix-turn-helix transcriptional regulator [Ferrimonas sp. SCSIO 43195]|uniref:helix-turn-helix transcriptional regulator n=1 Tax=Ferrimonas sp. SCSIO 43195 TaxID=2822844 RepID=UPI00207504F5|nr:helix-turn-helix transcriptional regulator [Ferrimonas sp. SCSIO 43195]USD36698.1 helix-turn-helix transcriptional regulator [Ferrimonas sp. SCSIO 43195]